MGKSRYIALHEIVGNHVLIVPKGSRNSLGLFVLATRSQLDRSIPRGPHPSLMLLNATGRGGETS